MKYLRAILIALLMPYAAAHATLITVDSPLGPRTAVLDTNSGLEWLKFSVTQNMSINQVFAAMEPGGSLEGFHYGTFVEFNCRLLAPNIQIGCQFPWSSEDVPKVKAFLDLFGRTFPEPTTFFESSVYEVLPLDISRQHGWQEGQAEAYIATFMRSGEPPFRAFFVEYDTQKISVTADQPQFQWLVREAQAIPEPSTLALLGLGVIALATLRKRGHCRSLTAQG